MRLPRRAVLALLLPPALAPTIAPTIARAEATPQAPVQALNDGLMKVMTAGRSASFAERSQMLAPVVQEAFDLPRILQNSIGARYASFPPEVQSELLNVFTQFTVASYVANFDDYKGERFDVLPQTRRTGADQVVQTRMLQPGGDPLRLDYVVHQENGAWKIVDILLNGSISRVAVQRSDFRSLLGNGDAGRLIASLRDKVNRLAAGDTG